MRVDEHTIDLAGSPVFFRTAGQTTGAATPLYLHGIPTSSDDWIPFLERTGGIAPDLIGFGRTGKGGHLDYSIEGHADFLMALLDHLQIERVQLIAHDWGAGGGLVFAQRHPERVERLVLIDALPLLDGFRWPRPARALRRSGVGELLMGATTKRVLARQLRRASTTRDAWPPGRIDAVWQQFDQGTQRAILRLYRAAGEQHLAQAGAHLPALGMPALVIWGDADPWLPPELARAYATVIEDAGTELVAGAGHWPWLDQPHVIDSVATFLNLP